MPAMVSQCWSQNENPGLPLWLTPSGKASGMRLLFQENPEQLWTRPLPVQWGPQSPAHLLLQACWGHGLGQALQRGPCGQRRGAYSCYYCSRMGDMGQDCVPRGGEAHPESFARRPRGAGGSDLPLDLDPAARPHWRMSHPAGTPPCPAASTSSAHSWLSGSLM